MLKRPESAESQEGSLRLALPSAVSEVIALQSDLEKIDRSADALGVPIRYSDLLFSLKSHINLVRQRLDLMRAALP